MIDATLTVFSHDFRNAFFWQTKERNFESRLPGIRKPEILSQRPPFVVRSESPTPTRLWNNQLNEVLKTAGRNG